MTSRSGTVQYSTVPFYTGTYFPVSTTSPSILRRCSHLPPCIISSRYKDKDSPCVSYAFTYCTQPYVSSLDKLSKNGSSTQHYGHGSSQPPKLLVAVERHTKHRGQWCDEQQSSSVLFIDQNNPNARRLSTRASRVTAYPHQPELH